MHIPRSHPRPITITRSYVNSSFELRASEMPEFRAWNFLRQRWLEVGQV